jgi:hypothetical protein
MAELACCTLARKSSRRDFLSLVLGARHFFLVAIKIAISKVHLDSEAVIVSVGI